MKKALCVTIALLMTLFAVSCGGTGGTTADSTQSQSQSVNTGSAEPATDKSVTAQESSGDFQIATSDGEFTNSGNVYTITKAGTYTLTGYLEGQILVNSDSDSDIVIELAGTTITCSTDSPIKILAGGDVDISAKKDTENVINDTRSEKTSEDDSQGEGAIYAKTDLKLKGTGTLVVNAGYNNGVHTTKDLTIQKLSLKSTAPNNALRGGDSVEIKSGTVVAISTKGDGVKTANTDADKSGQTRGDILIESGAVTVYAAGDGFSAAHNFVMTQGEDGAATVAIYTGSYSGYTASDASVSSYKGIKVQNLLSVEAGSLILNCYDDGLHADYGTVFEDGTKGQGIVTVSGGSITASVYSPENKTAGGRSGPGRWGGQTAVAGADAIHADSQLNISGGTIVIDSAYEGLEANVINVSGGSTTVSANDDGVNACKGIATPAINVTGGYLDVTVSPSGDTDGIDSNGSYTQSGGVVITRGPSSEMAAALDADGTVKISGGTLIVLGYGKVTASGSVKSCSLSVHSAGTHTVKIDGVSYTFTNSSAYGRTYCYSDASVSGT